jgi:hypothetical protein
MLKDRSELFWLTIALIVAWTALIIWVEVIQ